MSEIICPHCSKAFSVDKTGYANILKQVYDKEFESQLEARMNHANKEQEMAIKLLVLRYLKSNMIMPKDVCQSMGNFLK